MVGRKSELSLRTDDWFYGRSPLSVSIPQAIAHMTNFKVSCCIQNGKWSLPPEFIHSLPDIAEEITTVDIANQDGDVAVWEGASDGILTVKLAWEAYREKVIAIKWCKGLWRTYVTKTSEPCEQHNQNSFIT